MPVKTNKNIYIRRALFILMLVVSALIQHSGFVPSIFGARALLLIPAAVVIAMHEKSMAGLCFGAFAGILWDFATSGGDGFYSACLTVIGYLVAVSMIYLFRCKIYTAYILGLAACVLTEICAWAVFILAKGYEGAVGALLSFYIPSAIYSSVFVLLYYEAAHFIVKLTQDKK